MNEEGNKNVSGENEEQNGRRKVWWFLGRDEESNGCMRKLFVVGEDKGCILMEAKWELYSELNKNCFASHVFFCISVSSEMQAVGWLVFSFLNENDSQFGSKGALLLRNFAWIITASDFIVAAASVSKLCHTAFTVATEQRCQRDFNYYQECGSDHYLDVAIYFLQESEKKCADTWRNSHTAGKEQMGGCVLLSGVLVEREGA